MADFEEEFDEDEDEDYDEDEGYVDYEILDDIEIDGDIYVKASYEDEMGYGYYKLEQYKYDEWLEEIEDEELYERVAAIFRERSEKRDNC